MLVDNLPETRGVRVIRDPFEHQADSAIGQRSIDDVAVAGNPADIRRAPEHFPIAVIEDMLEGQCGL
ncbi:hypothetical protein D3C80_1411610 [compost metagenome]